MRAKRSWARELAQARGCERGIQIFCSSRPWRVRESIDLGRCNRRRIDSRTAPRSAAAGRSGSPARILEPGEARLAHDRLARMRPATLTRIAAHRAPPRSSAVGLRDIRGQRVARKPLGKALPARAVSQASPGAPRSGDFRRFRSLSVAHRPCFRLACMNSSSAPSSTAVVLPISTPVRRSLMRD